VAERSHRVTVAEACASISPHTILGDGSRLVADVIHASDQVTPGAMFCCVVGDRHDGHGFAADAIARGATSLLVERALDASVVGDVTQVIVDNVRTAMGPVASTCWGEPSGSLAVIGVTGTNGKTSVVTMIAAIVEQLGVRAETIGTLTGARTTPESTDLQRTLARFVAKGVRVVAIEVSSHALELSRVAGVRFAATAFLNLGSDHLDFHGTPERYFDAKARLFEPGRSPVSIVVIDDVHGRLLRDSMVGRTDTVVVEITTDEAAVRVRSGRTVFSWRGREIETDLVGGFNATNLVVAAECVVALGTDPEDIAAVLGSVNAPPGRMERVLGDQPFSVVVDYAHTPDAIERALDAARNLATGRLLTVIGAGGDRDRSKRVAMGRAAGERADLVIVTSDNPRSESPSTIMATVASGVEQAELITIEDRRLAIEAAIERATAGDVVVILGKGHETTQTTGDHVEPFDDRVVAADALAALGFHVGSAETVETIHAGHDDSSASPDA